LTANNPSGRLSLGHAKGIKEAHGGLPGRQSDPKNGKPERAMEVMGKSSMGNCPLPSLILDGMPQSCEY